MLYKASTGTAADVDPKKGTAVLRFSTYNSLDRDGDRSNKGMFTKSWREGQDDIRFLLNHDHKNPMGNPGKPVSFDEKDDGAYGLVKFGSHTLGQDCLKMVDEGVISGVSFGFDVVKSKPIPGKGKDFLEVKQWELSILTGWPAHPESKVESVTKSLRNLNTKALTDREQEVLRRIIANGNDNLTALVELSGELEPDSDLYTSVNYMISRQADWLGDAKSNLRWGMKELSVHLDAMKAFCANTTASDETIQNILSEIKSVEALISNDTATTTQQATEPDASVNKEFADALQLLTFKL